MSLVANMSRAVGTLSSGYYMYISKSDSSLPQLDIESTLPSKTPELHNDVAVHAGI